GVIAGGGMSPRVGGAVLSEEETKVLMDAILGGFKEQNAAIDGLTHEVAHLAQRMTVVEERLGAVEQGLTDLREELGDGLNHLGERWLEHDRDIYTLKRKQA
ncbi:MAG: hypothetical protein M1602_00800, partial [Firmicutes bacterium]|nr:hypothetical protein [Bacillota bacterium]